MPGVQNVSGFLGPTNTVHCPRMFNTPFISSRSLALTSLLFAGTCARTLLAADPVLVNDGQHRTIAPWATKDMVANPVSFCLDPKGNIYVAESFRAGTAVNDTRGLGHLNAVEEDLKFRSIDDRRAQIDRWIAAGAFPKDYFTRTEDRVRLIRDTDGDGVADTSSVFAGGFNDPLDGIGAGVLWLNNSLYYTCIPNLWKLTPSADGLTAQDRTPLARGWGVRWCFYGHDLHGLTPGPDGRIYFSMGDRGFNITTREGKSIVGVDRGGVFRCWPDGSELELYYQGLRNPQELAFDDLGELFTGDNNCDSGDRARVVHIVEGGDSGWRQDVQSLESNIDWHDSRGPWNREHIWETLKDTPPGPARPAWTLPPVEYMGAGPSGIAFYPGLGEDHAYDGHLFLVDFYGSGAIIHSFKCVPEGAGFALEDAKDFYKGVTVTDIAFGYDGRLYASDWGGGWTPNPNGSIFTISNDTVRSNPEEVRAIAEVKTIFAEGFSQRTDEQLLSFFAHRDSRVRLYSQYELANRSTRVLARVGELASDTKATARTRIHAIWCLGQIARSTPAAESFFGLLLKDSDTEVRAQSARVAGDLRLTKYAPACRGLIADSNPRVRLYAAQAVGRMHDAESIPSLLTLLQATGDKDLTLRHAAAHALADISRFDQALAQVKALPVATSAGARLGVLLALREAKDPRAGEFLEDPDLNVQTEAVRAIYDLRLTSHLPSLAAFFEHARPATARIEPIVRRAIEANVLLGDKDAATRLTHIATLPDLKDNWRALALERLNGWDKPLKREGVWGDWADYPARNAADGAAAVAASADAIKSLAANPALADLADTLVAAYLTQPAALKASLLDPATPPGRRLVLLKTMESRAATLLPETCRQLLSDGASGELRARASEAWMKIDPAAAAPFIADAASSGSLADRQQAIQLLGNLDHPKARESLSPLLQQLANGSLDSAIALDVYEAASKRLKDLPAGDVLPAIASQPPRKPGYPTRLLRAGGDPIRGKRIFESNSQTECVRCHTVNGHGGTAGPNLSGIGASHPVDYLVESVVEPGKVVAPGYGTVSAMPEMTQYLSPRQVRDVVAYLTTLKDPSQVHNHSATVAHKEDNSGSNLIRLGLGLLALGTLVIVARSTTKR